MIVAALYARVSTLEQVDNFSIDAQIKAITQYCKINDVIIFDKYIDEGVSGTKEDRPAFQRMLTAAREKKFNIILVHKYDRFARKVELSQKVKNQLKTLEINVISVTEPIEDSPMGFFQSGLMDLLAEYYIRNLSEEIKKGVHERVNKGLWHGKVPYAYKLNKETGILEIIEEEAKVVKMIYNWYLVEGLGQTRIANRLNDLKIQMRKSAKWRQNNISKILTNPVYIGKIRFNTGWIDCKHEKIIEENDFYAAKKIKDTNKDIHQHMYRGKNSNFLLIELLFCGSCGRSMSVRLMTANKCYYYVCRNRKNKDKTIECKNPRTYRSTDLEEDIINDIKLFTNDTNMAFKIARCPDSKLTLLENKRDKLIKELDRSKLMCRESLISIEEFKSIKSDLEQKIKEAESDIEKNIVTTPHSVISENIKKYISLLETETDIIKKKYYLRKIVSRIDILDDVATIEYQIPE